MACSDDESADGSGGAGAGASSASSGASGGAGGGTSSQSSSTGPSTASSSVGSGGEPAGVSILCGTETCVDGQKCCMLHPAEDGYCASVDEDCEFGSSTLPAEMYCDDAADCPQGACCVDPMGLPYTYTCNTSCDYYESCVLGSACSEGLCVPYNGQHSGALCGEDLEVTCDASACSGPAFACCFDGSEATCTAPEACADAKFLCNEQEDCGDTALDYGYCCATATGSSCQPSCAASDLVLCDSILDCPDDIAFAIDCAPPDPGAGLLPGALVCVY